MTKELFARLEVYYDIAPHSAAMNMAIDEALLESATAPSIRFYRWESPALSFGYFGRFADVADKASERDLVRRWTGGGIVFHGEDLTYSIVIPASDPVFGESSMSIYENVHRALGKALLEAGQRATVAGVDDPGSGINVAGYNGLCFANPVRADVIDRWPQGCRRGPTAHSRRLAPARQRPICRSWEWFGGTVRASVIGKCS